MGNHAEVPIWERVTDDMRGLGNEEPGIKPAEAESPGAVRQEVNLGSVLSPCITFLES